MTKRHPSPEPSNPPSPAADAPKWYRMVQNGTEFENSGLSSRRSSPESSNPPSPAADAPKWNEMVQNGTEFENSGPSSRRSSPESSNPPSPAADTPKWNEMVQNGTEIEKSGLSSRRSSPESSNPPSPAADAPKWNEMVQNGTEFENSALSSHRLQALPIIAAAPTLARAARPSGIGHTALYRWLQDRRFRHELTRLRPNTADLARYELRGLMLRCLDMSTNYPTLTIPSAAEESQINV